MVLCQLTSDDVDRKHNAQISGVLANLTAKYDFPGLEALIIQTIRQDQLSNVIAQKTPHPYHIVGYATNGTRRADLNASLLRDITIYDAFYIGSTSKSILATLVAKAIDSNQYNIYYNTTLREIFNYLPWNMSTGMNSSNLKFRYLSSSKYLVNNSFTIDRSWNNVTLAHLLTHTSGIPEENVTDPIWSEMNVIEVADDVDNNNYLYPSRRYAFIRLLKRALIEPPSSIITPSTFRYSNFGYMIIGLILEEIYSLPYETIIKNQLFDTLHMNSTSTGTGVPQDDKNRTVAPKQPYGHYFANNDWVSTTKDNPIALTAAGRIHMSILDWGKYVADHLYRARNNNANNDPVILKTSIYQTLQSQYKFSNVSLPTNYTIGAWFINISSTYPGGSLLYHAGSNVYFSAGVYIFPDADIPFGILFNRNCGDLELNDEIFYNLLSVYMARNTSNDAKWTLNDNLNFVGAKSSAYPTFNGKPLLLWGFFVILRYLL